MPKKIVTLYLLVMLFVGILPPGYGLRPETAAAAGDDLHWPRYFEQTGFWVQGPFQDYWENRGGLSVFGYPITGVFLHEDGLHKQYFERAIFEHHPEHGGTEYEVLLQRLGAIRTEGRQDEGPFQRLEGVSRDENCDFYQETGHRLCFGFKGFWHANGGLANFGYPISEEFDERNEPPPAGDGEIHTAQYFERIRLEWHPEHRGTEYEFLLGLLGSEYLEQHGAPAEALVRQPWDLPPFDPITALQYGPHVGHGFNVAWRGDDQSDAFHQKTFDTVNEAGFSWIRIQIGWRDAQPSSPESFHFEHIERFVEHARANNIRILASVAKAPVWATGDDLAGFPGDPAHFHNFMKHLSAHFNGRIDAYEIWNEQNLVFETGSHVDVGQYVELLKAGYTGVKESDPEAVVLFGGLTPTGLNDPTLAIDDVDYLRQAYAYNDGEIKQYYDVLGAHPGSNNNPPDTMWPGNPGPGEWTNDESFYFRRVAQLREIMVANGEGHKQIWLTEFGWSSSSVPTPGGEYAADNSEQDQTQYIVRAFEIAKTEWPWMGVMFLWNLNFSVLLDPGNQMSHWSVLNPDWSSRPAYEAIKEMPK
jgi:polysaccharide biosynthesis protein PslG